MGIIDLIFPKMCIGCRREGEYVCAKCQEKLMKPEEICPSCCKPSLGGWVHPRCRSKDGMDRLHVGLPYKGLVQICLKKVKYKSNWDIVECLCKLCKFEDFSDMTVTYVPMWKKKEQQRGFNQAEIVADFVVGLPGDSRKVLLLERCKETKPMFGLNKPERQKNIENVFGFVGKICPEKVLLVDDVWTTGATMRECAKTLKQNGVKEVWGLTLAR
jgi:competence protein ComFC